MCRVAPRISTTSIHFSRVLKVPCLGTRELDEDVEVTVIVDDDGHVMRMIIASPAIGHKSKI